MSKRKPARTIKARSASKIRSKAAGSGQPKGRESLVEGRASASYLFDSVVRNFFERFSTCAAGAGVFAQPRPISDISEQSNR
jgi:hypothetical protein